MLSDFFPLRSLEDFAGGLEEELLLCPVRALNNYLRVTSRILNSPITLIVSPSRPSKAISKNDISYFLRMVIMDAGALEGEVAGPPRAHIFKRCSH